MMSKIKATAVVVSTWWPRRMKADFAHKSQKVLSGGGGGGGVGVQL